MHTVLANVKNFVYWLNSVLLFFAKRQKDCLTVTPPPVALGTRTFLLNRQVVYDSRGGRFFVVPIDGLVEFYTFDKVFSNEDYGLTRLARHREIYDFYDALLAAGKTPLILDCGANVGHSLLYFSRRFPQARIIGIEPEPSNCAKARALNTAPSVAVLQAGVANAEGRADLVDTGRGNDAFRTDLAPSGQVPMISIDQILRQQDAAAVPFLIKIDIEGFEHNLFETNTEWIDRFLVLVVELHDWMLPGQARSRNFLSAISSRDRDFLHLGENIFSIRNGPAPT